MTVIADDILQHFPGRRSGYQVVVGTGLEVNDFLEALSVGDLPVKSPRVTIMVGCGMMKTGTMINMGNRLEKLINQIRIQFSDTQFWVCSILPRPKASEELDLVIKRANETISVMCKKLSKFKQILVQYVPIHVEFLEKWKHFDNKSKKMQISTRIREDWEIYFDADNTKQLTVVGIEKVIEMVERSVKGEQVKPMVKRTNLAELVVQIENTKEEGDPEISWVQESKPEASGTRAKIGGKSGIKRMTSDDRQGGENRSKKSTVSEMIQRWERGVTSQRDLDMELGEDSVVLVDLGDQPTEDGQDE